MTSPVAGIEAVGRVGFQDLAGVRGGRVVIVLIKALAAQLGRSPGSQQRWIY
jgi:hypothetical protein